MMARFRATIQGTRGEASRLGHRGITARINGWDLGVKVLSYADGETDQFEVYATGGSNARFNPIFLGHVQMENGAPVFVPAVQS